MKTKLLAILLLVGSSAAFAETHFSIGIGVGGYGRPYYAPGYYAPRYYAPPVIAYQPPCPGPGYNWVDGYYYGPQRLWRAGYWAPPVYVNSYGPGYYGGGYYGRGSYGRGGYGRGDYGRNSYREGFRGGYSGYRDGYRR